MLARSIALTAPLLFLVAGVSQTLAACRSADPVVAVGASDPSPEKVTLGLRCDMADVAATGAVDPRRGPPEAVGTTDADPEKITIGYRRPAD